MAGRFFIEKGGVVVKLTPKQNAFCLAYAASGNATESYKQAGYTVKTYNVAGVEAHRLLNNPKIQKRLQELPKLYEMSEQEEKKKIADLQEIQAFLTSVMRQEKKEEEIVVVDGWAGTKEKTPPIATAIKAAETLAKMQGAFKTDINITGALPVIISGEDEIAD